MPRASTHIAAADNADEDSGDDGKPRVTRTAATAAPISKPAGAMNSAFDVARPVKKPGRPAGPGSPPITMADVVVHKGKPIPPVRTGPTDSVYRQIWANLAVGDCAELSDRAAHGLVAHVKKIKQVATVRRLSLTTKGVWKMAATPSGNGNKQE